MGTLTLNDGTVLENSYVVLSGNTLYMYVQDGKTLEEVFNLLIEPEKTEKITAAGAGGDAEYKGYSKLVAVRDEETGLITATLKKQ